MMHHLSSLELMPKPFDWIDIPAGQVTLGGNDGANGGYISQATTFDVPAFSIAKYPLTNAQFAKFIEAGGYKEQKWWTKDGWQARQVHNWITPRFWTDSLWNGAEQPVVAVSWHESIAFCLWLTEITGEKIMLPTEEQWQYAAQGNDMRVYPWGNEWDARRCNNNVDHKEDPISTHVRKYEGKGDSPFGVVDMAGNILEWCLTDYSKKTNDVNSAAIFRVQRGGCLDNDFEDCFRCDARVRYNPNYRYINRGFRLSRC